MRKTGTQRLIRQETDFRKKRSQTQVKKLEKSLKKPGKGGFFT
jgi:hypothetical protein